LSACTIARLQREEAADLERVHQKELAVQSEQDRSDTLDRDKDQLLADLNERQVSLSELNERIERINAANGRAIVDNQSIRLERQRKLDHLAELNAQLTAASAARADQSNDDTSAQKQARIDYLRSQIKQQLELLLH
jgi:hypothetical protein